MIGLTAAVDCCLQLSLCLAGPIYTRIGTYVYLFGGKLPLAVLFNVYKRFLKKTFVTFFTFFNVFSSMVPCAPVRYINKY